jgi:hypothetical protein
MLYSPAWSRTSPRRTAARIGSLSWRRVVLRPPGPADPSPDEYAGGGDRDDGEEQNLANARAGHRRTEWAKPLGE